MDPSILDLRYGKILETETQFQETMEAEVQDLKSLTDDEPWEKRQNLVSAEEENDTQGKARDKATAETTNSSNH